jgi:hypothetical protein
MDDIQQQSSAPKWPQFRVGRMPAVTASWTLAGGLAGGTLVAALVFGGRVHPDALQVVTALLVSLGAALGMVHGFMLGVVGRPEKEPAPGISQWALSIFGSAAAWVVGMVGSLWLGMSTVVAISGRPIGWIGLTAGGLATATILVAATVLGWRALSTAFYQWPDHALGAWLVCGTFVVLSGSLLAIRPALPGTQVQLTVGGTLMAAALATLWIALPAIVLILPFAHRTRS